MGMFDTVYYKGVTHQSKDTPSQSLAEYAIENEDLWFKNVKYQWVDNEKDLMGGHLDRVSENWEHLNDFSGQIIFYTDKEEYLALFWEGKMIKIKQLNN